MGKYFRLYYHFFRVNAMKATAYRGSFWFITLLTAFESAVIFFGVTILFQHLHSIAGWTYPDMMVLLGVFLLTNAAAWFLFKGGVSDLDKIINTGTLDYLLIKPADSQFLVSVSRLDLEDGVRGLVGILLIIFGLKDAPLFHTLSALPAFVLLFLCGQLILYSLQIAIKTVSFKSIQGWATNSIGWRFHELAQYPTDIYHGLMRLIYTFVFPLVFIATVPAKALTGRLTLSLFLGAILATCATFFVSRQIWKFALKIYSSASS